MDPKMKQSLLEMLEAISVRCAEKSTHDDRFKRLHHFISEYSEFARRPEEQDALASLLISTKVDSFEREGLLEEKTATVLRGALNIVVPPDPKAGKKLYRMAYGPWWKRLFR
jgi:hypothetical protein